MAHECFFQAEYHPWFRYPEVDPPFAFLASLGQWPVLVVGKFQAIRTPCPLASAGGTM